MTDTSIERVKYYTRGIAFMSLNNKNRKKPNTESEEKKDKFIQSIILKMITIISTVFLSVGGTI